MKYKLIKINTDHYIVVDDSEIKEGDWIFNEYQRQIDKFSIGRGVGLCKKTTHSTEPLNDNPHYADYGIITLREVKELIGEVDVEKKAEELTSHLTFPEERREGIIIGYNQALEDNKEKKYTEEDMKECVKSILRDLNTHNEIDKPVNFVWTDSFKKHIQSLQPKTEWEVEFDENNKLRLL